jgi:hypothetical protein
MLRTMAHTSRSALSFNRLNLLLCGVGAGLHLAAYLSLLSIIVAGLFYSAFYTVLVFTRLGGSFEREIFNRIFAIGWVAAGVAAIYAIHLYDAGQLYSDAGGFFDMAASQARGLSLIEIQLLHEGALAIMLWANVYDFLSYVGFPRERYVGITVNVTALAMTAVITLKMARLVYGVHTYRFKRLTLLFSACGMFWLFAGIHVRDSIVLLAVSVLGYAWLQFLSKPSFGMPMLKIIGVSLLAVPILGFLRDDFLFVPVAMATAAVAALLIGRSNKKNRQVAYGMAGIGFIVIVIVLLSFGDKVLYILSRGNEGYAELASEQHGSNSLGMSLIIDQPLSIRIILGFGYLYLMPIPFWAGFQFNSVYALFKSFNVIFFYFMMPLFLMAIWQLWRRRESRSVMLSFLGFLSLGFTTAIAGTSLETRHLGVFLPYIFLLSMLPDLENKLIFNNYKKLLFMTLLGVLLIHLSWMIIKEGFVYLIFILIYILISLSALLPEKKHKYTLLFLSFLMMLYLAIPFFKIF